MGEPCSVDAECETLNCSTDGDDSMVGHCNQELGTRCTSPTRDRVTATCTQCMFTFGVTDGICFRAACDPVTANHCQSFGGHEFQCDRSTEGTYHCYELCEFAGDDCWYDTVSCYTEGDYCR
jgi:hypothetical protein